VQAAVLHAPLGHMLALTVCMVVTNVSQTQEAKSKISNPSLQRAIFEFSLLVL
jgi:hypothetical protein